jgi:hypothetical protein
MPMRPAHSSNPNNIYPLFLFIFVARYERIFVSKLTLIDNQKLTPIVVKIKSAEHLRFLSAFPPQFPTIIAVFLRLFPYLPNSYYLCSGFKLGANLEPL